MNERMDKLIAQTSELLNKDTSQMKLWDLIEDLAKKLELSQNWIKIQEGLRAR